MAKISTFKRIIIEDFDSKDRALISKLAYPINSYTDDVTNALNHNLSITDNLNMATKSLTVTVDASGKPTSQTLLKTGLINNSVGLSVIKATNVMNGSNAVVSSTPFITYTENSQIITITNITGLPANVSFTLIILIIGS